jgi:hypothetical protein
MTRQPKSLKKRTLSEPTSPPLPVIKALHTSQV